MCTVTQINEQEKKIVSLSIEENVLNEWTFYKQIMLVWVCNEGAMGLG